MILYLIRSKKATPGLWCHWEKAFWFLCAESRSRSPAPCDVPNAFTLLCELHLNSSGFYSCDCHHHLTCFPAFRLPHFAFSFYALDGKRFRKMINFWEWAFSPSSSFSPIVAQCIHWKGIFSSMRFVAVFREDFLMFNMRWRYNIISLEDTPPPFFSVGGEISFQVNLELFFKWKQFFQISLSIFFLFLLCYYLL